MELFQYQIVLSCFTTYLLQDYRDCRQNRVSLYLQGFTMKFAASWIFLIILLSLSTTSSSLIGKTNDRGSIRGAVRDAETLEALVGATIRLQNKFGGAISSTTGEFQIENLSPGTYSIRVSHIGYALFLRDSLVVSASAETFIEISLRQQPISLKTISVSPGSFSLISRETQNRQFLSRQEIETKPQLGDDLFRSLNHLPGVSTSDFSAKFTIRGGAYDEVLVTLDGLQIYEPFHLKDVDGGAMSIIDIAAVEGIDLMTGGFPAVYGGKMSGVFNIRSKRPTASSHAFSIGLSIMNVRILAEGSFARNQGYWLFSVRRGYFDIVLDIVEANEYAKPSYYDMFAKVHYQLSKNHHLAFHVLQAEDNFNFADNDYGDADSATSVYGNSYAWVSLLSELSSKIHIHNIVAISEIHANRKGQLFWRSANVIDNMAKNINSKFSIGFKSDWEIELSDRYLLRLGGEAKSEKGRYDFLNQTFNYVHIINHGSIVGYRLDSIDSTAALFDRQGEHYSGYVSSRIRVLPPLVFEAGVYASHQTFSKDDILSPRFNLVFTFSPQTSVRGSLGYFDQPMNINELHIGDGDSTYYPTQRAQHLILGLEHNFKNGIFIRLDGYHKRYSRLSPAYDNYSSNLKLFAELEYDRVIMFKDKIISQGIELIAKHDNGGFISWWVSYSISKIDDYVDSTYLFDTDTYDRTPQKLPSLYDQRHTLNLDLILRPNHKWQINTSLLYHSGWRYTDMTLASIVLPNRVTRYFLQPKTLMDNQLKDFFKLDLRVNRNINLKKGQMSLFLDVHNVLGTKNIRGFYYYAERIEGDLYLKRETQYWFGRFVSAGISYTGNF